MVDEKAERIEGDELGKAKEILSRIIEKEAIAAAVEKYEKVQWSPRPYDLLKPAKKYSRKVLP